MIELTKMTKLVIGTALGAAAAVLASSANREQARDMLLRAVAGAADLYRGGRERFDEAWREGRTAAEEKERELRKELSGNGSRVPDYIV